MGRLPFPPPLLSLAPCLILEPLNDWAFPLPGPPPITIAAIDWPSAGLRSAVIVAALLVWHWTQKLIASRGHPLTGLGDWVHDLTAPLHRWFSQNDRAANRALIISSLFIDGFGLFMIAASLFGPSFAPFIGVLIVFSLRQACQAMCSLPPPPGIIWRDPGMPSLLVTYGVANDFFFSGHTALAVLGAAEVSHLAPGWLAAAAWAVALGEMAVVLVLRAHYTLDVIAGAFAAFFAHEMASRVAPAVDGWLKW